MPETISYDEAVRSLFVAGPGGCCADCGHFAYRHHDSLIAETPSCLFPRGDGNPPCDCAGMLWQGHRIRLADVLAVNT